MSSDDNLADRLKAILNTADPELIAILLGIDTAQLKARIYVAEKNLVAKAVIPKNDPTVSE